MSLEELMKDGKAETFQQYRDGELWYRTASGFDYPTPVTYKGDAAFFVQENALHTVR
jgi:hypothetical protein